MRILYAIHGYKPAYKMGGPINSVSAMAESLVARKHQVVVFTTNCNLDEDLDVPVNQPVDVNGVEVWYFKREEPIKKWLPFVAYLAKSIGFLYAPAMRAELDRVVPSVDVVHTQMPYVYPTYAAGRAAIQHDKPLFYHQRGVYDPKRLEFRSFKKRLYINVVERPIMKRATTLIALTPTEVDSYRALGVRTTCRIIPNGVDRVDIPLSLVQSANTRFGILPDDLVVLFMARLHPIKGADRLIRSFLMVHRLFPCARLVMAGPDEWGIVDKFKAEIRQAGAENRVLFPGMIAGSAKQELLARANLFCLPSDAEGFSMAILEALAYSTAALLSPGCHFPEVERAGAGRVVDAEVGAMTKAMNELLADRTALTEMGRKGRELVIQKYSWDVITDTLLDAYQEGIERHSFSRRS